MIIGGKLCSRCKHKKRLEDFGRLAKATGGLDYYCRACRRAAFRKFYDGHPERFEEYDYESYNYGSRPRTRAPKMAALAPRTAPKKRRKAWTGTRRDNLRAAMKVAWAKGGRKMGFTGRKHSEDGKRKIQIAAERRWRS